LLSCVQYTIPPATRLYFHSKLVVQITNGISDTLSIIALNCQNQFTLTHSFLVMIPKKIPLTCVKSILLRCVNCVHSTSTVGGSILSVNSL